MGIIACRARLLLNAKKSGVDFSKTLTLGRQMNNMTYSELTRLRKLYHIQELPEDQDALRYRSNADLFFFHYLGVKNLSIIDVSDYQGADIIHDLNVPIRNELEGVFDVIIDGGTLEHIFNFPTAVLSCMKMLKTGGTIFVFSMANNHCGHGFYQFSPELFFRLFHPANGFEMEGVILVKHRFPGAELSRKQECFRVQDPAEIGRRLQIVTKSPLGIMVQAKKVDDRQLFSVFPQQSDYASLWRTTEGKDRKKGPHPSRSASRSLFSCALWGIWRRLPPYLKMVIEGYQQLWKFSLKHKKTGITKWP